MKDRSNDQQRFIKWDSQFFHLLRAADQNLQQRNNWPCDFFSFCIPVFNRSFRTAKKAGHLFLRQAKRCTQFPKILSGYKLTCDEIRHMIIARLVDRIDAEEGNKITIQYKVSFEQFMNTNQASA